MSDQDEKKKKCPLCGATIPADAEVCPYCGAQLDIFNMDEEIEDIDTTPFESFLDSIGDSEDVDPEKLLEEMQSILGADIDQEDEDSSDKGDVESIEGSEAPHTGSFEENEVQSQENGFESSQDESVSSEGDEEELVEYVCPVCGQTVGEDDLICPHCGAIFVEDEEDMKALLENELDQAKTLIKDLRSIGVDVSDITPFLKNANIAKRKGETETALENAISCVMAAKKKLEES